jgi:hypothetical protein
MRNDLTRKIIWPKWLVKATRGKNVSSLGLLDREECHAQLHYSFHSPTESFMVARRALLPRAPSHLALPKKPTGVRQRAAARCRSAR